MITYKIKHHIPGRIRIEVPFIKGASISGLIRMSKQLSAVEIPTGIKDIRPNPFTGSVVITYEPDKIDILKCINDMTSNIGIFTIIQEKIS